MNTHRAQWSLLLATLCLWFGQAVASDKYIIDDENRMDDTRLPTPSKALIYFVRTQNLGGAISVQ